MAKRKKSGSGFLGLLAFVAAVGMFLGGWLIISKLRKGQKEDSEHSFTMNVGDKKTLETTLTNPYSCAISGENIVDYNEESKLLTALASGQVTVSATDSVTGESESFLVTVVGEGSVTVTEATTTEVTTTTTEATTTTVAPDAVTSISLSYYSANVLVGEKRDYAVVTMQPWDAPDKGEIWASSNELIAKVDEYGNITGIAAGDCVVTCTAHSNPNVVATIEVKVYDPEATTLPVTTTAAPGVVTTATTPSIAASRDDIEIRDGITYVQGIMIANKTFPLPATYNPGLQPEAQAAFTEMQTAAAKDGLTLNICSGFRSYETQNQLYLRYCNRDGKAAADRYSARPGHSEHQTGYAMDINMASSAFNNTPEAKWIAENCWKYGFILRYPEGKEDITGYMYESWHVRWLGEDLAKKVFDSGLTLEEYLNITSVYAEP